MRIFIEVRDVKYLSIHLSASIYAEYSGVAILINGHA